MAREIAYAAPVQVANIYSENVSTGIAPLTVPLMKQTKGYDNFSKIEISDEGIKKISKAEKTLTQDYSTSTVIHELLRSRH